LHADRHRLNRLVAAGWLVLHVTSLRLRTDLDGILTEITAALAARRPA
jgi:very-short-patch-repair endonuclease